MAFLTAAMTEAATEARKEWGWFLALGIALIVVGVAAILYEFSATLASVFALGSLIFVAGVFQIFTAFRARGAGHIILYLLGGVLDLVIGYVLMEAPFAGALAITLILGVYFIFSGIMRVIYSLFMQFPQYGWSAFSGLVSLVLGILLWRQWPSSAIWFLGLAVGVNFILFGISWSAFALKLRSVPA